MGIIERSAHNPFSFGAAQGGEGMPSGMDSFDQQSLFDLINSPMVGTTSLVG